MTTKAWMIFVGVVVVLLGGLVYFSGRNALDVSQVDTGRVLGGSEQSGNIADHVFGNPGSKVVLVEYGDFQCPGCGQAHEPLKAVAEKYKDELAFVYRNYPLTSAHPNAKAAAVAAEAAGKLGKYWEMHGKLFTAQNEWGQASTNDRTTIFTGYAVEIGLDKAAFEKVLTEEIDAINQKINFDLALGKKDGVTGTPTLLLNGKKVEEKTAEGSEIWNDAEQFEEKVLLPAFKAAGIQVKD